MKKLLKLNIKEKRRLNFLHKKGYEGRKLVDKEYDEYMLLIRRYLADIRRRKK